uniref:Major facilitator superfamily (MFS) profile domain-containing protein n=1 Tax=Bionectria ochroleuca TaxID=29856 RepID=A0A8H7NH13_BIOOC
MSIDHPISSSSSTIAGSDIEAARFNLSEWIEAKLFGSVDQTKAINHSYEGNGTEEAPFIVRFMPDDPQDATTLPRGKKWVITLLQAAATLALTFASSAYSGGIKEIIGSFHVSQEVATLGVSIFVLGFAVGPLIWAPLSELYGRRNIFIITFMVLTVFNVGATCATNIQTLLALRFFASAFGSSILTNAGGVIADMFDQSERGLATSIFAMAPFMGPVIGPIVGGFLGQAEGWRWLHGLFAIFTGVLWILGIFLFPETYAPFTLRRRAAMLSRITGKVYISTLDAGQPPKSIQHQLKTALTRPWILLFKEPIVFLISLYHSIIYGTLYMCFAAFPIVFQIGRGWSPGIGGLAFIGSAVGVLFATLMSIFENNRYSRLLASQKGLIDPEARLPMGLLGSIFIPVGLFWFAWTTFPTVHWVVPIMGTSFFSFGLVSVFLSLTNYLIDSYVVFAASVLAANSVLRSLFGAAFPLFTRQMYNELGNQWASSIPAFLALACVPCPFLFYRYGDRIRMKCEYASEAARVLEKIRAQHVSTTEDEAVVEAEEIWRARSQVSAC